MRLAGRGVGMGEVKFEAGGESEVVRVGGVKGWPDDLGGAVLACSDFRTKCVVSLGAPAL